MTTDWLGDALGARAHVTKEKFKRAYRLERHVRKQAILQRGRYPLAEQERYFELRPRGPGQATNGWAYRVAQTILGPL